MIPAPPPGGTRRVARRGGSATRYCISVRERRYFALMGTAPLSWIDWQSRWPNAAASRFVVAGGLRWHVQVAGDGPALLLVHGTAGATHSWGALLPRLAERFRVIAPDLPGHGFTEVPAPERLTLPGMAADLARLLHELEVRPAVVAGHSAGAAILMRMALDGALPAARCLVGFNAAIIPPPTLYTALSGPAIRGLFTGPRFAGLVARLGRRTGLTEALLASTGSDVPPDQVERYEAIVGSPAHVQAALTMMAQWDVPTLLAEVHRLALPALLLAGERDRWIPPTIARRVAEHLPGARFELLRGQGHLMHETPNAELLDRLAAL